MSDFPYLGYGLGFRVPHYQHVLEHLPKTVDWFEIVTENFLVPGGRPLYYLSQLREHYPVVMHGVAMSVGGTDPLDENYLRQVKQLAEDIEPAWISDHLCWTSVDGVVLHDLMPLPYDEDTMKHVAERIQKVQDYLGRQILIENVSSYVSYQQSEMSEWEFIRSVAELADCYLLLDVNNVYVNAVNHGFDPKTFFDAIPVERVKQFHIAGHTRLHDHIVDTHDEPICDDVWECYRYAVQRFSKVSTLLERDDNIPAFEVLEAELAEAKAIANTVLEGEA